jgi:hypothetical protein
MNELRFFLVRPYRNQVPSIPSFRVRLWTPTQGGVPSNAPD